MAFAQGSRSSLAYIAEVTFGTTPAGNFQAINYTSHSLDFSKDRVQGNDIYSDRMVRHDRHGNKKVAGDIVTSLRADEYDDWLQALMFGTWDTSPATAPDELIAGSTFRSFSIEDYAADIDQSRVFTGCAVSSLALSIKPNQMVQATWGLVGSDMSISATQKTLTAASLNAPFDAYSGAITVGDNGGALSSNATITGIDFTIDNGMAPTYVVGSASTPQLEYGMLKVEGTITAYFVDTSLINRFINETESAFKVTVDDPTAANSYGFEFPRVKFNGAAIPVQNPQSRLVTIPFVSLYDSTATSNLIITRPETA